MIKLIASDMDGTLLNDRKELPADFLEVFGELERRGIRFTVASGRSFDAVAHLFPEEYRTRLDFICDNGANIIHAGKQVHVTPLDRKTFDELIGTLESIGGARILVCAGRGTYHLSADPEFSAEIAKYYKNHIVCEDFRSIDDIIYKLAVFDARGTKQHAKPAVDAVFGDRLNVQVSGPYWMDIMGSGVSKGSALRGLGKILGIGAQDTMAFGDFWNDEDMLRYAGWSFAMENGDPDIKRMARFLARSNNENGVLRAVRQYALQENV